jgi:hypothetical protein
MRLLKKLKNLSIIDNLRTLLDSAASNADTITLLSSQMNKFIDLVKLLTWINSLAEQSTSGINSSLLVSLEIKLEF